MAYDTGNRKHVRAAEKAAKLGEKNRHEVLAALAGTAQGRRYLWDLLESANVFASTYNDNAGRMAFLEGRRSAGLELLADWMSAAPDDFIQAMREANARRTELEILDANRTAGERPSESQPGWEPEGPGDAADGDGAVGDAAYH